MNKQDLVLFEHRLSSETLNNVKDLQQLKNILLETKNIHNKYKNVISDMDLEELKNFLYTEDRDIHNFEGVAPLFTAISQKDFIKITQYIFNTKIENNSILRLMFYCIENKEIYKNNKFYYYLSIFENKFLKKFKGLLFELGHLKFISKIDLLWLFQNLIK